MTSFPSGSRAIQFLIRAPRERSIWDSSAVLNALRTRSMAPWLGAMLVATALTWIVSHQFSPVQAAGLLLGELVLILIARIRPQWMPSILLIAFVLSPRLTAPNSDAPLKVDDMVCAAVLVAFLLKRPFSPEPAGLDLPWLLLSFSAVLSVCAGLLMRTLVSPLSAWMTLARMIEFAVAFYLATAAIQRKEHLTTLLHAAVLSGLALALIGTAEYTGHALSSGGEQLFPYRIFNASPYKGETNHMAGYLFLVFCLTAAMGLTSKIIPPRTRIRWCLCSIIFLTALVMTSSRSAIALSLIALVFLAMGGRLKAMLLAAFIIPVTLWALPDAAWKRFSWITAEWNSHQWSEARLEVGLPPDFSYTRNRFEVWSALRRDIQDYPWLGTGPGSRHRVLYENQYMMVLAEMGLLGLLCFLWLLIGALRGILSSHHALQDWPGLIVGLAAAFVGICLLGMVSISFSISRMAGPLWLLIGAVVKVRRMEQRPDIDDHP